MVDRQFAYTGAIPQNTDILSSEKNVLYGIGHLIEAVIGSNIGIAGLAIAPTGPATMSFTIGRGSMYQVGGADATAYGDLGSDSNTIGKQGLNKAPVTLTVTAPGTSGYSQYYLVQVSYTDTDAGATVLPYYNSSNPSAPYAGPGNAGTSNYTVRQGLLNVALKAGVAAPTGSEAVPAADAGYTGVYVVHVTNGQTQVTSANWYTLASAPFFPNLESLTSRFIQIVPATTFYVNNSVGSDSNDGLSSTVAASGSHGPWATIAHAIAVLGGYNFGGQTVTIQLGLTGVTYACPPSFQAPSGGTLVIQGNTGAQGSYTIGGTPTGGIGVIGLSSGTLQLSGLTLANTGAAGTCNVTAAGATINLANVTFAGTTTTGNHIVASSASLINILAGCIFSQSAVAAITAINGGIVNQFASCATSGAPAWSTACCLVYNGGIFAFASPGGYTFTNTGAAGPRYSAVRNGIIDTQGSGANYFAGNSAGSVATGGVYN
jgi:hypothetical protein